MAKIQVYNFAFSSEKVVSSESGEKYAQIKHHLQSKTVLNTYSMLVDLDVRGQQRMRFFLWKKRYYGPMV